MGGNTMKAKFHIKNIIIVLLSVLVVLTFTCGMYIRFGKELPVKEYEPMVYAMVAVPEYDKSQAIKELKQLINVPHVYIERDLNGACLGLSMPLYRLVFVQKGLKDSNFNEYILTYAHELTHLKGATSNECWTTYHSLITLYESNNEYFRAVAWNESVSIMRGNYGGDAYDCGAYLIAYFKQIGIIA